MGALSETGPGRIEQQYQADMANPNRLAPQASGYLSRVLGGQYLDPNTNPHLGALTSSIWESVAPNVTAMFSRAGRGTSASDSGLAGALTRGFTSAMAAPLFSQYNTERGLQQQAAGMAGSVDATASLPLEQYLERMRSLATLGQQGTSSQTASPLQTIAGLGLTAAGMFGGGGPMAMLSDIHIKTDIERIGEDPRGWGVYSWRYVWDPPETRHEGFMAHEVALIEPAAVGLSPDGWLTVDYGALQ
jgi:hypothetical protein